VQVYLTKILETFPNMAGKAETFIKQTKIFNDKAIKADVAQYKHSTETSSVQDH